MIPTRPLQRRIRRSIAATTTPDRGDITLRDVLVVGLVILVILLIVYYWRRV